MTLLRYINRLFALAIFSTAASVSTATVIEPFDAGAAGFVANTTSSVVVWTSPGGNPGGHLQTRKLTAPPAFDIGALTTRADLTGDFAAKQIVGVSVDLNPMTSNVTDMWIRFRIGAGSNGWRIPLTVGPTNTWTSTGLISFDPTWSDVDAKANGWVTDMDVDPGAIASPPFATVMSSVGSSEVRIASAGSTIVGIDNFRLVAVPEPSAFLYAGAVSLIMCGIAWRRRSVADPV